MRYGWIADHPDQRDFLFLPPPRPVDLPPSVDLRAHCPPIYDQGDLGSCTANAIGGAVEFDQMKQGEPAVMPSRLFVYYYERLLEGTIASDSGAQIRDGMKVIAKYGAPPESDWPYVVSQFADAPPPTAVQDGLKSLALEYLRLDNTSLHTLKACLAAGFPFVSGFTVYQTFESQAVAASGVVPLPYFFEPRLGGHAVMTVGYDDATARFLVRNSWGAGWGMQGYFTVPYRYWTNPRLADDFWTLRRMS